MASTDNTMIDSEASNAIAINGAAMLYPVGTNDQIIAQATRLAKERPQHVQEDTRRAMDYRQVRARNDLLRWAKTQR